METCFRGSRGRFCAILRQEKGFFLGNAAARRLFSCWEGTSNRATRAFASRGTEKRKGGFRGKHIQSGGKRGLESKSGRFRAEGFFSPRSGGKHERKRMQGGRGADRRIYPRSSFVARALRALSIPDRRLLLFFLVFISKRLRMRNRNGRNSPSEMGEILLQGGQKYWEKLEIPPFIGQKRLGETRNTS